MTAETGKGQTQPFIDARTGLIYLGRYVSETGEVVPDEALTRAAPALLEALREIQASQAGVIERSKGGSEGAIGALFLTMVATEAKARAAIKLAEGEE